MLDLPNALYALCTQLPDEWLRIALTMLFMRHNLCPPCRLWRQPVPDKADLSILEIDWPVLENTPAENWHQLKVQCLSDGMLITRLYKTSSKLRFYECRETGIDKLLRLLKPQYKLSHCDTSENAWATMYELVLTCTDVAFLMRMTGTYCVTVLRRYIRRERSRESLHMILGLLRLMTTERKDCVEKVREQCQCVIQLCHDPQLLYHLWESPWDAERPEGLLVPDQLYRSLYALRELNDTMPARISV